MAKKKKRRNRHKKTNWVLAVLLVFAICVCAVVCLKITEKIGTDIEHKTYPLEHYDLVNKYSKEYGVPKSVILAVIKVESNYNVKATSYVGASGLMQLMPDTFTWLASTLGESVTEDQIYDPELNIKYGVYYLSTLYSSLENWETVYAAYNAGKRNVLNWLEDPKYSTDGVLTNIPFPETADYVTKVTKAREKYIELYHLGERL